MQLKYKTYLLVSLFTIAGDFISPQVDVKSQPKSRLTAKDFAGHSSQKSIPNASLFGKEPTTEITLQKALSLTLVNNPELVAFDYEVRVQEARELQARLFPNPEFSIDVENFGGSGVVRGFDEAENSIKLSQIIELGGKRKKRIHNAILNKKLASWDYETKRLSVLTDVTKLFVEVLAAQERLSLTGQLVELSEKVFIAVSERVKTGKVSPVEEIRAGAALSTVRIASERSKQKLVSARLRLLYALGDTSITFVKTVGELERIDSIPRVDQLVQFVSQNPDIARWVDEMDQRQSALKMEESTRVPDLSFSGGVRHLNETDVNAFVFDLSIPLTLFDRNQWGVLEAQYEVERAEEGRRATELRVLSRLMRSYESLAIAYTEATALKNEVLPAVERAFDAVITGYDQGKFNYLDILDTQRILFNTRDQYLSALTSYHKAVADVEGMIGQPLTSIDKALEEN